MNRRLFLSLAIPLVVCPTAFAANQKFVGNILIEASDVEAAKTKLQKRYPGCMILKVQTK